MRDSDAKKELVRRFFDEVWNNGNFDFIDEHYAEDFTLHALWENPELGGAGEAGVEAATAAIRGWRTSFPDLHVSVEEQLVEGDIVTSRHVCVATNDRPFQGIPPTGKRGSMSGMTQTRVVDGKITDAWTMWDVVGLLRQFGVIPDPAKGERNKALVRRFYQELWNEGAARGRGRAVRRGLRRSRAGSSRGLARARGRQEARGDVADGSA